MRRSQRRRLLNLFAMAVLAFAIYLVAFYKDEEIGQPTSTASVQIQAPANK